MAKSRGFSKKQTGTKNGKAIGASLRKFGKTLNPWGGPNVPNRAVGQVSGQGQSRKNFVGGPTGSSMRKPVPDSALRGMQYPANDPLQWPVVPDRVGYTRQPSASGITPTVITNVNASIEKAYSRAKYQP